MEESYDRAKKQFRDLVVFLGAEKTEQILKVLSEANRRPKPLACAEVLVHQLTASWNQKNPRMPVTPRGITDKRNAKKHPYTYLRDILFHFMDREKIMSKSDIAHFFNTTKNVVSQKSNSLSHVVDRYYRLMESGSAISEETEDIMHYYLRINDVFLAVSNVLDFTPTPISPAYEPIRNQSDPLEGLFGSGSLGHEAFIS